MTNEDQKRVDAFARNKAGDLRNVWLQEREARLAAQLAANTEVRKRWFDADSTPGSLVKAEVVDFTTYTTHPLAS